MRVWGLGVLVWGLGVRVSGLKEEGQLDASKKRGPLVGLVKGFGVQGYRDYYRA